MDSSTSNIITATTYGDLISPLLVLSNNTISTPTNVDFTATSRNTIPTGSIIKFAVPKLYFQLPGNGFTGITLHDLDGASNEGTGLTYTLNAETADHWNFQLTSWCGTNCPDGQPNLNFRIKGFINADTTKPVATKFSLTAQTSDNYDIEQVQGLASTPSLIAGPLKNVNITRSPSNVVGVAQTYTIEFQSTFDWGDANGAFFAFEVP